MTRFSGGSSNQNGLKVEQISSLELVDAPMWDRLNAACFGASVFQSRQWLTSFARIFRSHSSQLKLFGAWQDGQLVGLAPLMRAEKGDRAPVGDWLILGDDYSDYQVFSAWDDGAVATQALLNAIDAELPPGESVVFNDVPQHSTFARCLEERMASDRRLMATGVTACPALRISGNESGVARVLAKDSVGRNHRRLRRRGALAVEHVRDAAEIRALLPGLFAQHVTRWQETDHPSLFCSEANRRFYEELTSALAPIDGLEYTVVRLDGAIVSQHFGLRTRSKLLWYKPAFETAFRRYSPGEVMLAEMIAHAEKRGLAELDFTRGDEPFKARFASLLRFNRNFTWHRRAGDRLRAELRNLARTGRDALRSKDSNTSQSLGGARQAQRKDRVLLLNADEAAVAAWASVVREGVEVRASMLGERPLYAESSDSLLVVPCDIPSISALAGHGLRLNSVPPLPDDWQEPPSVDPDAIITCVCSQGSVLLFFALARVQIPAADLLIVAQRELDRRRWDGAATLHFSIRDGGKNILVARVLPYLERVEKAVVTGINLPLALWRMASGLSVDPQPIAGGVVRS